MREIKFKVWDSKRCVWLTPDEFLIDNQGRVIDCGVVDSYATAREGLVLVEYTGLKDKNGVGIFEGDVIRWYDGLVPRGTDSTKLSTVRWNSTFAMFDGIHRTGEAIGNIHENPELVNEQS